MRGPHDSSETFVRVSHDSCETFPQLSHDIRANIAQFYLLSIMLHNGLIYVAIYSHLNHIFVALCGLGKMYWDGSEKGSL